MLGGLIIGGVSSVVANSNRINELTNPRIAGSNLKAAVTEVACYFAGRVSPVHRGASTAREGFLVHMVQPAGRQAQVQQETREAYVDGGGTTC